MRYITTDDAPPTPLRGIADHSWHVRGLCHGMTPEDADEIFFPKPRDHQAIAEAKSLCGRCPVKRECFTHALDNAIKDGIWGGLTEAERRPWHAKVNARLDYARVRAAFAGRDVHLSDAERAAVTRHAYVRGWTPERLAHTLQLDLDYARDLMREAAHAVADRDRYWDLYDSQDEPTTAPDQSRDDEDEDEPASSPVTRQVHTHALIAALGKASQSGSQAA
ncbi:WhiB family transcriptional regulator [Streptomyces sp. NPDC021100]|uniref:WhiB family transcriptional regulator n=1 Tax=Streptomyces sp. NPDC021100 TaxID=3365114 RepID=UPI0037896E50